MATTENDISKNLVLAIQNKKIDTSKIFKSTLNKKEIGINSSYEGKLPLSIAIQMHLAGHYDLDFIETLLMAGADPDLPFEFEGNIITPLMLLSHYHYESLDEASKKILPIIMLMLEIGRSHGVSLNLETDNGNTPIVYAAENNNLDMVYFLLTLGADPLKTNIKNRNALEIINANNESISPRDEESYNILKQMTKFWQERGGFGKCLQSEFTWDFQDGKLYGNGLFPDGMAYKEIILTNYITNAPMGVIGISLAKIKEDPVCKILELSPKEKWFFQMVFKIRDISNASGDVQWLAIDLETGKNSQTINMHYTIENGNGFIECQDQWPALRLARFIRDKKSVYMYPNFKGVLAGLDFSFHLNEIPSLIEFFK